MLWVYDHYTYFYTFSTGIDFSRHNLTSTDISKVYPRVVRVKATTLYIQKAAEALVTHIFKASESFQNSKQTSRLNIYF